MKWIKTAASTHQFRDDSGLVVSIERHRSGANVRIGGRTLSLRSRGFWRQQFVLTAADGEELTVLQPAGWLSSNYRFRLYGQDYTLVVRNSPLAEFAVQQDGKDLLAYGLKVIARKPQAVVTRAAHFPPDRYELDVLLWYLFAPVAQGETACEDLLLLIA